MTENGQTEAEELADFLTTLAGHLRQHPTLPRAHVWCGQGDRNLQLGSSGHEAERLHAWFTSLDNADVEARPSTSDLHGDAYVAVTGHTESGVELRVWDTVPGLGVVLGYTAETPRVCEPIDEAVLVDFALTNEEAV